MNEDMAKMEAVRPYRGTVETNECPAAILGPNKSSEILRIATRMEQFINDNGWSWCDMDRVYRVLKAIHQ